MVRPRLALPSVFALAAVTGCSSSSTSGAHNPTFADVKDAPQAIRDAADAVVRIETAGEAATGSFISGDGQLLTNNHVLGVSICPTEGCYASLSFFHQRGDSYTAPQSVFVIPLAVDVGLDMALVQAYQMPNGPKLPTPHFLTIDSHDAASLQGTHVNVVGHPEGNLKKWTQGQVFDAQGTWIWFSTYSLPGNSGSPVLDDAGHLVGILHRGPTSQDLFTGSGTDEYAIGTASAPLIASMNAGLPSVMGSVTAVTTDDAVVANQALYLNARVPMANVGGTQKAVVDSLGAACDVGLQDMAIGSPDDLSFALNPCFEATSWIDCGGAQTATGFTSCPTDIAPWQARYAAVNQREQALNGQVSFFMASFAPAALQPSGNAQSAGATALNQLLASANPVLDFSLAAYLLAFQIQTYGGQSVGDFVTGYRSYPDYGLYGAAIANDILWMMHDGQLAPSQALGMLNDLASQSNVDVEGHLFIEEILYENGALN